jgi:sugar/nucleoside kinase (ribokinase family)
MFTIAGHIVKDIIVEKDLERTQMGGPPLYAAITAQKMRKKLNIITKIGDDLSDNNTENLIEAGVRVSENIIEGRETTKFIIKYSKEKRTLSSISICEDIYQEDLINAGDTLIISPVIGEISFQVVTSINPEILILDPQGYVRQVNPDKTVSMKKWFQRELLEKVTVFKSSEEELKHIINLDTYAALGKLINLGVEVGIATIGEKGAVLIGNGKKFRIPSYPQAKVLDTTGAGDVFLSAFTSSFLDGEELDWCASVGSAYSSSVIETEGPIIRLGKKTVLKRAEEIFNKVEKFR